MATELDNERDQLANAIADDLIAGKLATETQIEEAIINASDNFMLIDMLRGALRAIMRINEVQDG